MENGLNNLKNASPDDPLAIQLKEMLTSIEVIKGKHYRDIVSSIFSLTNAFEALFIHPPTTEEQKEACSATVIEVLQSTCSTFVTNLCIIKHPDYLTKSDKDKKMIFEDIGDEVSKNVAALGNKQFEFWGKS